MGKCSYNNRKQLKIHDRGAADKSTRFATGIADGERVSCRGIAFAAWRCNIRAVG